MKVQSTNTLSHFTNIGTKVVIKSEPMEEYMSFIQRNTLPQFKKIYK